jgi:hypothetical protein
MAALQAQQAPPAPAKKAAAKAEAPVKSAAGKDATSTPSTGKASSSIVIYDLDKNQRRQPTADEIADIKAQAPNEKHFVKYTEQGQAVMDIPNADEVKQLEASFKANSPEAKAQRKKEARQSVAINTGVGVALDMGFAYKLYQGSKVVATTGKVVSGAAKGLGVIGGKVLPAVGIVFGGIGIAGDIARWNNPNNKKKGDDVARIAGNTLSMVGSGLMIAGAGASVTGVGAIAGVPLAVVGLVVSGVGLLVNGLGSWFDDDN